MDARFAIQTFMLAGILSSHQAEAPKLKQTCDKDTEYRHAHKCCRLCPAGTYVVDICEQNHGKSTCQECPPNSFLEFDHGLTECHLCRKPCEAQWKEIQIRDCSPHHNRECRCMKGTYKPKNFEVCVRHTPCPAGQGVLRKGSYRRDTICHPCPPGTFSKRSSFEKCKPWTNCAVLGLETGEDGNASKDAKCGDRLQPQQTLTTSGPAQKTSSTWPMVIPTISATVPQNNSHASTTVGSVVVTSTAPTSQTTHDSDKSTTTETSSGEDRHPGPNNQPTMVAVSDFVTVITSVCAILSVPLIIMIIVFIVWHCNKKKGDGEKIAVPDQPPIGAVLPHHQQQPEVPSQGGDLNPQDVQNEHQALLPRMEQDERELEPDDIEQARFEQNQQVVQISGAVGTGAPGGQQLNLGVYQDQRCLYDARNQTVQFQIQNATVHHHFGSPEFVQIGTSNTINQGANTVDSTNPEPTNSDVTGSEPEENDT